MQLVLFDFDGTLTRRDSFSDFLWFAFGPWRLLKGGPGIVLRFWRLWWQGHWSNGAAKCAILDVYFKGWPKERLERKALEWNQARLQVLLQPSVLDRLRAYKQAGDQVVLVSASPDLWLKPFCEQEGLTLLCTELAYEEGRFAGRFKTPNCNGAEKARRIKAVFDLSAYKRIVAFGNSSGDHAMFALAQEAWLCGRHAPIPYFKKN